MAFHPIPAFATFVAVIVGDYSLSMIRSVLTTNATPESNADPIAYPIALYAPYIQRERDASYHDIVYGVVTFCFILYGLYNSWNCASESESESAECGQTAKSMADILDLHIQVKTLGEALYEKDSTIRSLKQVNAELQAMALRDNDHTANVRLALEIIKSMSGSCSEFAKAPPATQPLPPVPLMRLPAAPPPPAQRILFPGERAKSKTTQRGFLDELKNVIAAKRIE
jgi:hypothetical protein